MMLNNKAFRFVMLILFIISCLLAAKYFHVDIASVREYLNRYPLAVSGAIFIALYTIVTFFIWFGTIDLFRISGAILFGGYVSGVLVSIAELINAFTLFHLSRKLGREYIAEKFKLKPGDGAVKKDAGILNIFALRINPFIPFRAMDLGYGLTQIDFKKYFLGIVAPTFVRVSLFQIILAGMGAGIFNGWEANTQFFLDNPLMAVVSAVYLLFVVIVSIAAVVLKMIKKR